LAAAAVFAGTTIFSASVERFAAINIAMTGVWILLCVLIAPRPPDESRARRIRSVEGRAAV